MNGSGTSGSELEEWSWSLLKKKRSKASGDKTLARVVRLMGEFDKTSYEDIDQKMRDEIEHADEVPKDIATRKRQGKVNKTPAREKKQKCTCMLKGGIQSQALDMRIWFNCTCTFMLSENF